MDMQVDVFFDYSWYIRVSHRFCPMITKVNRSENVWLFFTEATGTVVTKPVPEDGRIAISGTSTR
jgi:hypothetical protein